MTMAERILTIDQGNSSSKAQIWIDGVAEASVRMESSSIEELLPLLATGEIEGCAFCSVCHNDAKFLETLRRLVDGRLIVLTPSVPLPMEVNYGSCESLGSDRVAAVAGAWALFAGDAPLVVDAGTAVTIDATDSAGNFMGGNIAPGMSLRFRSLHEATQRLPLTDPSGPVAEFGFDTASAIRSGVVGGMVSEIVDAFHMAARKYGCRKVVLAGTDGAVLAPLLSDRGICVAYYPSLVGRGLLEIYRYNTRRRELQM